MGGFIEFESMTMEDFEAIMKARSFWYGEDGFWRKLLVALWVGLLILMALEVVGAVLELSPNGFAAGVLGIVMIPAALVADYHKFKKGW